MAIENLQRSLRSGSIDDEASLDVAIDSAFAELERSGRPPEQARLELEIRHPELARSIATVYAMRAMLGASRRSSMPNGLPRPYGAEGHDHDRYTLVRQIGCGACGVVYEAVDAHADSAIGPATVAVKILAHAGAWWSSARGAFEEAGRVASVSHPALLKIHDTGIAADGSMFIVSELGTAGSLQALLLRADAAGAGSALDTPTLVRLIRDVGRALHAGLERGLVHGNVKPSNVILFGDPADPSRLIARLGDFGGTARLGLRVAEGDGAAAIEAMGGSNIAESQLRALRDSLLFAPPERRGGQATATTRGDVYSLAATLRYALRFTDPASRRGRKAQGIRPDPRLAAILDRATSADESLRHESPAALALDLDRWLAIRPIPGLDGPVSRVRLWARRSPLAASIVTAGVAGLGVTAGFAADHREKTAYAAGADAVADEFTEAMTASAISWDRVNPLRDWIATGILLDRLQDSAYFENVGRLRQKAQTRAQEIDERLGLLDSAGQGDTLNASVLRVELALHQLRSPDDHPDTRALIERALADLDPVMPAHDPLRQDLAVLADVEETKRFLIARRRAAETSAPLADHVDLMEPYLRLKAVLSDRSEGMTHRLLQSDRRDPVLILALRAVSHLSGPGAFDDMGVRAWCDMQLRTEGLSVDEFIEPM